MQKKLKRIICIVMTILMLVTVMPVTVFAAESCGTNTNWEYKKDNKMIYITGTGSADAMMSNYESSGKAPWYSNVYIFPKLYDVKKLAKTVSVNGTTSVGAYAFANLGEVTTVTCSASVKKIGHHAFANEKKLSSVTLPAITTIRESAFEGCSALTSVSLPAVERIDSKAFANSGLISITIPDSVIHIDSTAFSGCSNLVVTCSKGSYADTFCTNNGIKTNYTNSISLSAGFNSSSKKLELTVSLSGSKGFESGMFTVTYNSAKMTYVNNSAVSASSDISNDNIAVNSPSAGKLVVSVMLENGMSADSGSLIKLAFTVSSSLAVQDSADFSAEPSHMSVNGTEKEYKTAELKNVNLHSYSSTAVASTCTTKGYTLHKCAICAKEYKDNELSYFANHNYKVTKTVAATCTKDGSKTEKCSVCGKVQTTVLPKTGHNYVNTVIAPTCSSDGYTIHKCSLCGSEYKDSIVTDRNAHVFETTKLVEPTCTKAGYKTEKCTVCGFEQKTDLPATGHKYVDTVVPPTCKDKGYTVHKCSACGDEYTDSVVTDLNAHVFEITGIVNPTCTEAGLKTEKCTVCGFEQKTDLPATGHSYVDTVIAPTCKDKGYTVHKCSVCGDEYTDSIVTDLNAHVFETTELVEPTCEEAGYKKEKCTICGFEQTTELPATGHSYVDTVIAPTCKDKGYTLHKCSVCSEEIKDTYTDTVSHTYEKQTTPAGCTEDGANVYTCTVCGNSYSEKIPALGHKWDDGVIARPATKTRKGVLKYTCNTCGETRNEEIPALSTNETTTKPANTETTGTDNTNKNTVTQKQNNASKVEIKEGETSVSMDESLKCFKVVPPKSAGLSYAEFKGLFKTAPDIKNSDDDKVATSDTVTANGETYTVILLGDLDSNGKVTAADARLILRISAKLDSPSDTVRLAADLDSNTKVTAKEARSALRFSARLQNTII